MSASETNWQARPLGELATTTSGGTPSRTRKDYYGGSIPWVKSGELNDDYIFETEEYITEAGLQSSSAKLFPSGTVLIALYGATVGKTSILGIDAATNQAVCGISPGPELDGGYLRYHLIYLRRELLSHRYGGAQPNISQQIVRSQKITFPPLPEQKNISHILSTVQRAIKAQERIIQTTTELKKALMHKLFTEGLRNEPQKQTEIGPVPNSWAVATVGDFAKIQSGGTPARDVPENWAQGTIPWVKTGEIDYCVIKDTEEKITPVGLSNSAARLYPAGTLLMAMYGQGITRGRVGLLGIEAATNQACASISPIDEGNLSSVFLYYYFQYHYDNLRALGQGANQRNMNAALIRSFPVSFPQAAEQTAIVAVLESLDVKSQLHQRKREQLQGLFRTFLSKLMTAKISLKSQALP